MTGVPSPSCHARAISRTSTKSLPCYLKVYEPHSPNIAFRRVFISFENLRRHVQRRTDERLVHVVGIDALRETEIGQLENFVPDKNILWFDVTMDDTVVDELVEAHADLFEEACGDLLGILAVSFHPKPQIALA